MRLLALEPLRLLAGRRIRDAIDHPPLAGVGERVADLDGLRGGLDLGADELGALWAIVDDEAPEGWLPAADAVGIAPRGAYRHASAERREPEGHDHEPLQERARARHSMVSSRSGSSSAPNKSAP